MMMNKEQEAIINILRLIINKSKVDTSIIKNLRLKEVYDEIEAHNITALVYYVLDKELLKKQDNVVYEQWKKKVFLMNMSQIRLFNDAFNSVEKIINSGYEVIFLKGSILKRFYKAPELRTMGDIDILVRREDEDNISKILLSEGYEKHNEEHKVHCEYIASGRMGIEVHRKLVNEDYFNGDASEFENDLWNNIIEVEFKGKKLKSLSLENLVVHLILHMAVHAKYSGFGLRQIVDLALLMKEKSNEINWNDVHSKLKSCNMMKFTVGIIKTINNLFEVAIPKEFNSLNLVTEKEVNSLLDLIMLSGVNGKKDVEDGFNALVSKEATEDNVSKFKKIKMLAFPKAENMTERYNYAKKNKVLLPIAWIHHAYYGVVIKKHGIRGSITSINKGLNVSDAKNGLIKTFEL